MLSLASYGNPSPHAIRRRNIGVQVGLVVVGDD